MVTAVLHLVAHVQYRTVVVNMFKTARSLKRKQMTEEIVKQHGQDCDSKTLTSVLKVEKMM